MKQKELLNLPPVLCRGDWVKNKNGSYGVVMNIISNKDNFSYHLVGLVADRGGNLHKKPIWKKYSNFQLQKIEDAPEGIIEAMDRLSYPYYGIYEQHVKID